MEDDIPAIYGLEFQTRALSAQTAETDIIRFLVGTQSLKFDNQVHMLEIDDESGQVSKAVYLHPVGEIWHLSSSPTDPTLLSTCYNQITSGGRSEMRSTVWRLPDIQTMTETEDSSSATLPSLQLQADFNTAPYGSQVASQIWHPTEPGLLTSVVNQSLLLWDITGDKTEASLVSWTTVEDTKSNFVSVRWNPHQNCSLVAATIGSDVRSYDLRSMKPAWQIHKAHSQQARELDFNPNKQYYLATCGDDCLTKFWDCRNPTSPVLTLSNHSHWVWSVRYNHFHDQLVLTSSSDSRVVLNRVASISSEPYGHLVEDEDTPDHDKKAVPDAVAATYEEHEDSVYAAEWSTADPWMFASLSYDGRLVINKVPRAEKYRILL